MDIDIDRLIVLGCIVVISLGIIFGSSCESKDNLAAKKCLSICWSIKDVPQQLKCIDSCTKFESRTRR